MVVFLVSIAICWGFIGNITFGQENIESSNEVTVYPLSDQTNDRYWVLDENLSDEFNDQVLNMDKWQPIPYTWSGAWRWEDKNVSVYDGSLRLRAQFDQNTLLDETPNGWSSHNMYDGDSINGEYITSIYGARSGDNALVYSNFFPIWVRTDTVIEGLDPTKTYQFSAYIKKSGNQPVTQMFAVDPSNIQTVRTEGVLNIYESVDYVKYTMIDVTPSQDGKCKIGFEVKADPYSKTIIDDVFFAEEGTNTNLAPNSGFEDVTPMNYSSGGIISRQSMKYGYMETRARGAQVLPGTCSAIWLLGRTQQWGTEIDVLEIGQSGVVNQMEYALHTFKTPNSVLTPIQDVNPHSSIGIYDPNTGEDGFNPSSDYHVYGLEWGPGYQNFYIDGKLNGRYYSSSAGQEAIAGDPGYVGWQKQTEHAANMDAIPQNLLLSLGLRNPYWNVGDTTPLDTVFDVDYVRVWSNDNPTATGNITSINAKYGNIVVPYGTTTEELSTKVDNIVTVILNDDKALENQKHVPVIWDLTGFDGTQEGTIYEMTGTLIDLPVGVTNTNGITAQLHIYIQPKPFIVDKDTLQILVNRVYVEEEYKKDSWENYQINKGAAQLILDLENPTVIEIEQAYEQLMLAIKMLERLPNLEELIIQEFYEGNYTSVSWSIYSQALSEAKVVNSNEQATALEIETAYNNLKVAMDGLERLPMGTNLILGKQATSNVAIDYSMAASDGSIDETLGWGPSSDKSVYTTINAGVETGGSDNGYEQWPGAYLQYDFGEEKAVKQVEVYRFWYNTSLDTVTFKDCIIQLSTDSNFDPTMTTTIFGGETGQDIIMGSDIAPDGSNRRAPQIITLDTPMQARYIRIIGKGHFNPWNINSARMSYSEIKVFEVFQEIEANLLEGKQATSNVAIDYSMAASDGSIDETLGWGPSSDKSVYTTINAGVETGGSDNGYEQWPGAYLQYDFGEEKAVKQVEVYRFWYNTSLDTVTFKDCIIQLSTDSNFDPTMTTTIFGGETGQDIIMGSDIAPDGSNRKAPQIITLDTPVQARYIRIIGKGHFNPWNVNSARMSYSEIKVFEASK